MPINGRIMLSLTGGMPDIPLVPVPRIRLKMTVSALSFALWAVASFLPFECSAKNLYRISLAASSVDSLSFFASSLTLNFPHMKGILRFSQSVLQNSSSLSLSLPRRQWFTCRAETFILSLFLSSSSARSRQTLSAPPDRAVTTSSPASSILYFFIISRIWSSMFNLPCLRIL